MSTNNCLFKFFLDVQGYCCAKLLFSLPNILSHFLASQPSNFPLRSHSSPTSGYVLQSPKQPASRLCVRAFITLSLRLFKKLIYSKPGQCQLQHTCWNERKEAHFSLLCLLSWENGSLELPVTISASS